MIKLMCGNCMERLKEVEDGTIDLIVTDPPYRTTSRGSSGGGGMLQKRINLSGKVFLHNDIKPSGYAKELFRVLKPSGHCYVMTNHINLYSTMSALNEAGLKFVKCLIWDKGNKIMGQMYMSQFEYILFYRGVKGVRINDCSCADIISVRNRKEKDSSGGNLHDSEKPVELMKILISNSSKEGEIVLDPFMGIGATGVACVNTGRSFIGIEIDKEYYKISKRRIKEAKQCMLQ